MNPQTKNNIFIIINMVIKILIPTIIILVIFFILRYNNIYLEHFTTLGKLEISFSPKDSIFMISDNIQNITQKAEGTIFKKTDDLIFSNDTLFSEDGNFSGFLFSIEPGKKIRIGFSNLLKDKKDEISHGIDIVDDDLIQIVERISGTDTYNKEDINYCLDGTLEKCSYTKNNIKFDSQRNMLGISLNNNRANYLIFSKDNKGNYGSMLIHRGGNKLEFPFNLKVISHDEEALVPTLLWTKKNYVYDSPVYWSVETKFKDDYDAEILEVAPALPPVYLPPAPPEDNDEQNNYYVDFGDTYGPGEKIIKITRLSRIRNETNFVINFEHNLDNRDLNIYQDRIFLKIYSDEEHYLLRKFESLADLRDKFSFTGNIYQIQIKVGNMLSNKFKPGEVETIISDSPSFVPGPS